MLPVAPLELQQTLLKTGGAKFLPLAGGLVHGLWCLGWVVVALPLLCRVVASHEVLVVCCGHVICEGGAFHKRSLKMCTEATASHSSQTSVESRCPLSLNYYSTSFVSHISLFVIGEDVETKRKCFAQHANTHKGSLPHNNVATITLQPPAGMQLCKLITPHL